MPIIGIARHLFSEVTLPGGKSVSGNLFRCPAAAGVLQKHPEAVEVFSRGEFDNRIIGDTVHAERVFGRQRFDRGTIGCAAQDNSARAGSLRAGADERLFGIMPVKVCAMRFEVFFDLAKRLFIGQEEREQRPYNLMS